MSGEIQELIQICEQLPAAKRAKVTDFARFLLAREGDERWEQVIASPAPRPKLDAFLKRSKRELAAEPLDPDRLCNRRLARYPGAPTPHA
jgi:hypothetical protein